MSSSTKAQEAAIRLKAYLKAHNRNDQRDDHIHAYGTVEGDFVLLASDIQTMIDEVE